MPEAVNSISTNAPEIHSNSYSLAKAYALDNLYDLSSGLHAFKVMLTSLIDTSGLEKISGGIGVVLDCLIKDFDNQTDTIEQLLKVEEKPIQEPQSFEERHSDRINEIKTILRNATETENKRKKKKSKK